MIDLGKAALKIFVALEHCDMRKFFIGLFDATVGHINDGKLGTDMLVVFSNKRKDRIKLIYFEGTGLWVAAKRLEVGRFSWTEPSGGGQKKIGLRPKAFQLIMDVTERKRL